MIMIIDIIIIIRSKPVCEVGEEEEKREVCSFTYTQVNIIIIVIIINHHRHHHHLHHHHAGKSHSSSSGSGDDDGPKAEKKSTF